MTGQAIPMLWRRRSTEQNPLAYDPAASLVPPQFGVFEDPGETLLQVEDVFTIAGRGTVVTGTVAHGSLGVGEALEVVAPDGTVTATCCIGIEQFRKKLDRAVAGEQVGVVLRDVPKGVVARGSYLRRSSRIA